MNASWTRSSASSTFPSRRRAMRVARARWRRTSASYALASPSFTRSTSSRSSAAGASTGVDLFAIARAGSISGTTPRAMRAFGPARGSGIRSPIRSEERAHARTHEPDPEAVAILRISDVERACNFLLALLQREEQLLGPQPTRPRILGGRGESTFEHRIVPFGLVPARQQRRVKLGANLRRQCGTLILWQARVVGNHHEGGPEVEVARNGVYGTVLGTRYIRAAVLVEP